MTHAGGAYLNSDPTGGRGAGGGHPPTGGSAKSVKRALKENVNGESIPAALRHAMIRWRASV
jgi:hypothetical protein